MRAAGIAVEVGLGAHEARELNIGFFSRMIRKKPWVRMKIAASLDGRTALENGASQWITSESARTDGHVWRARACAVLTGIGTILKDNPRLDVRLMNSSRQPQLVVVDSNLATPLDAHIFMADRALYIYTAVENDLKKAALEKRGATVVYLPGEDGQVNLSGMLLDLGRREINELHVEAGQRLNGSLFDLDLVDEMVVYLAPKLIGQGYGIANIAPLIDLSQAISLEFMSIANVGPDLQVITRVLGHNEF